MPQNGYITVRVFNLFPAQRDTRPIVRPAQRMTGVVPPSALREHTDYLDAVAAVEILTQTLRNSTESTLQGLLLEVRRAADEIKRMRGGPDLPPSARPAVEVLCTSPGKQAGGISFVAAQRHRRARREVCRAVPRRRKSPASARNSFGTLHCSRPRQQPSCCTSSSIAQRRLISTSSLQRADRWVLAERVQALRSSGISCETIFDAAVGCMMGK